MTRDEAKHAVLDHLYGEMSSAEEEAFRAFLESDPEVKEEWSKTQQILSAYRLAPSPPPPREVAEQALRVVQELQSRPKTIVIDDAVASLFPSPPPAISPSPNEKPPTPMARSSPSSIEIDREPVEEIPSLRFLDAAERHKKRQSERMALRPPKSSISRFWKVAALWIVAIGVVSLLLREGKKETSIPVSVPEGFRRSEDARLDFASLPPKETTSLSFEEKTWGTPSTPSQRHEEGLKSPSSPLPSPPPQAEIPKEVQSQKDRSQTELTWRNVTKEAIEEGMRLTQELAERALSRISFESDEEETDETRESQSLAHAPPSTLEEARVNLAEESTANAKEEMAKEERACEEEAISFTPSESLTEVTPPPPSLCIPSEVAMAPSPLSPQTTSPSSKTESDLLCREEGGERNILKLHDDSFAYAVPAPPAEPRVPEGMTVLPSKGLSSSQETPVTVGKGSSSLVPSFTPKAEKEEEEILEEQSKGSRTSLQGEPLSVSPAAILSTAQDRYEEKDFEVALRLSEQAIAMNPPPTLLVEAYLLKAKCEIELRRLSEAERSIESLRLLDPRKAQGLLRRYASILKKREPSSPSSPVVPPPPRPRRWSPTTDPYHAE